MTTTLITGGMGFLGSHTAPALVEMGRSCVVTYHRKVRELGDGVSAVQADVSDREAMLALGERHRITGIVHLADPALAHLADPDATPATLVGDLRAGSEAFFNVLECALAWGVQRVTVVSTIGVYGGLPTLRGVDETLPLPMTSAGNVVAASKKTAELLSSLVSERAGVQVVNPRLPAVWGPLGRKQSRFFAAPAMIHGALAGSPAGAGAYEDDAIDMLYVKDCARAIALLQTADTLAHTTYNVGCGRAVPNREIAAAIKRVLPDAEVGLEPGHGPHDAGAYLDTTRLREETGFEPEYDPDRATADYIAWLLAGNEI